MLKGLNYKEEIRLSFSTYDRQQRKSKSTFRV